MSNQSITEYLSAHEFFSEFSDDDLKFLCECSRARARLKRGKSGMVQKRPILGNTDNSNPTRILRVSID